MIDELKTSLPQMQRFLETELNEISNNYIRKPLRIVSDYNNEVEKTNDYNGRQLLEMLQNADDEAGSALDRHLV